MDLNSKYKLLCIMTNKDFFDTEFYKFMQRDYEDIRARRNKSTGRPSKEEITLIQLERQFESFYRRFL